MKIQATGYIAYRNVNSVQNYRTNKNNKTVTTSQPNVSFRGKPWVLNPAGCGVPQTGELRAIDAILLYEQLACGNYLDIGDDKWNYTTNNNIREKNLAFLDRVVNPNEQKKFIEYYTHVTGFPDLQKVSDKIKGEFVHAVDKTQRDLYKSKYTVSQAGYDGVCSVGRGKAFPGSDLDKAYVIIRGSGYNGEDVEAVNQFKGGIWKNTDQRILSYNHDEAAFPQVYTEAQVDWLIESAEMKKRHHIKPSVIKEQETKMGQYSTNYINTNPYYIELCKNFPRKYSDRIDIYHPSKENIKNIGFVLESMREGEVFQKFGEYENRRVTGSDTYKLANLSQLQALKSHNDRKPKRLARDNMSAEFNSWDVGKQYRFIKTLIKSACANNKEFTGEFPQYFSRPGQDLFAPLLKTMMR